MDNYGHKTNNEDEVEERFERVQRGGVCGEDGDGMEIRIAECPFRMEN